MLRKICIGIPVQSEPQRLRVTLDSVCRRATDERVEIIVLPDDPDPVTKEFIAQLSLPIVTGGEGLGAAACFNRLAAYSDADVIVLLESGARVGRRWLEHLLRALGADARNGLAGPSTNVSWNEQAVFSRTGGSDEDVENMAREAEKRFGDQVRTLEPLFSLADFCYVVRREVIDAIGAADERYSLGPCWEMDYNIRAARAGWRGVWAGAAYVHRAPFSARRRHEESRRFESSKHLYQDKFCGARLRGEKNDYRGHCRGDDCPNFAPPDLIEIKKTRPNPSAISVCFSPLAPAAPNPAAESAEVLATVAASLVTCIMPTYNRRAFVPQAIRCFLRQNYANTELLVVDDGADCIADCIPETDRIRYLRLDRRLTIGAKRNFACERAHGEFIVHWDDDDWYAVDRVTRQIAALHERNSDISGSSRIYYYDVRTARAWEYRFSNSSAAWVGGNTLSYRKSFW